MNDHAIVKITDMLGNERRSYRVNGSMAEINLDGLEIGMYFVIVESRDCRRDCSTLVVSK
jgi:hypothetical protein